MVSFSRHLPSAFSVFSPALCLLWFSTQEEEPPYRFETGTQCHEGIAGAAAAVEFIADLGRHHTEGGESLDRRAAVVAGMHAMEAYGQPLAQRVIDGLSAVPGLRIYGPPAGSPRTSTVSFTLEGHPAPEIARTLGEQGLFVWDGDSYAVRVVELAGLADGGDLLRIGLCPYSTADEVERVIAAVAALTV